MTRNRFTRVQGTTSYLALEHSNVGLFVHKKRGVLIDSGYTEEDAQWIGDLLESDVIRLEAILQTHAHPDVSGGASYLKKRFDCKVLISSPQRSALENPKRSNYISMVQAAVEKENSEKEKDTEEENAEVQEAPKKASVVVPKPCRADGVLNVNRPYVMSTGKAFTLVDLSGHVVGQYGVVTPDKVFFIAKALYTFDELQEKPIPHLESVEQFQKSLKVLLETPYSHFVPSHGKPLEFSISNEVLFHQRQIEMISEAITLHLQMPHTKEELIALLFATFNIEETIPNFYMMSATIMSFLNTLKRKGVITLIHEDGKTRWFTKQKWSKN